MTETTLPALELLPAISSERLHLILMPTEACNFRCVYCYEDFRFKRMEPWVVRGVKALLSRRAPGLRSLEISWFGGEPLLAADVVEEIMLHVRDLLVRHTGIRLAADMTTNGSLADPAMFRRMLDLGVSDFQVSVDGPREWHDRRRVTAGGRGTYDRIWGNLLAMRATSGAFAVQVRVHASRGNADLLPAFLETYREAFGGDDRFRLFLRGISRLGGPNDAQLDVLDREETERVVGGLRSRAGSLGLRLAEAAPEQAVCYAAHGNSFLVRSNGRLNKCTVALEHPANQVGRLREDGTVEILGKAVGPWMRGFWTGSAEELKCPMHGLADGPGADAGAPGPPSARKRAPRLDRGVVA